MLLKTLPFVTFKPHRIRDLRRLLTSVQGQIVEAALIRLLREAEL